MSPTQFQVSHPSVSRYPKNTCKTRAVVVERRHYNGVIATRQRAWEGFRVEGRSAGSVGGFSFGPSVTIFVTRGSVPRPPHYFVHVAACQPGEETHFCELPVSAAVEHERDRRRMDSGAARELRLRVAGLAQSCSEPSSVRIWHSQLPEALLPRPLHCLAGSPRRNVKLYPFSGAGGAGFPNSAHIFALHRYDFRNGISNSRRSQPRPNRLNGRSINGGTA